MIPTEYHLTIYGHARPSVRITRATKWLDEASAYLDWQKLVGQHCLTISPRPIPWQHFEVEMLFFFVDDIHGDRINLGKSTEDGLAWGGIFPPKKLKSGRPPKKPKPDDSRIHNGNVGIRYCDHHKDERVEITIREFRHEEAGVL